METDGAKPFHLLLVEDDDGDAYLVEELLAEAGLSPDLTRAWSLQAALDALSVPVDCVLLDLGLPDATGLDALVQLRAASDAAFVVLTGLDGIDGGVAAVAAGAEDYLVKGRVDGESLGRAVRYAVERRRAARERSDGRSDGAVRAEQLTAVLRQLRQGATPAGVRATVRSDAAADTLSTELFEVGARPDETILTMFGHVVGDGPAAAAQAAVLRASFGALALAGLPLRDLLEALERVARHGGAEARVVLLDLDPAAYRASVVEVGHRGPLLIGRSGVHRLSSGAPGAPLGAIGDPGEVLDVALDERDRLLLIGAPGPAEVAERGPDAVGIDVRDVIAASGRMDDDLLCDTLARVLRSTGPEPAGGHLALLGWTSR